MKRPTPTHEASEEPRASVRASLGVGLRLVEDRMQELSRSRVPFLQESVGRLLAAGGKRYRPQLVVLSYLANGGNPFTKEVIDVAALVELLHTATLIHDDIIDDADLRRGILATHRQYGTPRAILCGDNIVAGAFSLLMNQPADVQETIHRAGRLLAEGEAQELELTRTGAATLEEYFEVIAKKTASLLEASAYAGARLAHAKPTSEVEALSEYGFNAGIAFQLIDDLLDVEGVTELTGKPTQLDLTRGVPNAAVLATLEADLRGKPRYVPLPSGGPSQVDDVLSRMTEIGGDERVRRLAAMYAMRGIDCLQRVAPSDARDMLVADLQSALMRRH